MAEIYRITQGIYEKKKLSFSIEKKGFWGWSTLYSGWEEFVDGKIVGHKFETYEDAEKYLIESEMGGWSSTKISGNVYIVTHISFGY